MNNKILSMVIIVTLIAAITFMDAVFVRGQQSGTAPPNIQGPTREEVKITTPGQFSGYVCGGSLASPSAGINGFDCEGAFNDQPPATLCPEGGTPQLDGCSLGVPQTPGTQPDGSGMKETCASVNSNGQTYTGNWCECKYSCTFAKKS